MTDRNSDSDLSVTPEPRSLPSLHWERAVRAEIQQSLAEHRQDDALALAESLLRGAYPRQLDVFRLYGELCQKTGRFERGFQVLWKAAELIEQVSPWYGIEAWLALSELAPTDIGPLRRAIQAGRERPAGLGLIAQRGLRAAYAAARAALLESQPGGLAGPEVAGGATGAGARVLVFPAGRVGVVQTRPWASDEPWTEGSPARGHVVIPAGHEARLRLDEDEPRLVEVLERLGPGDVQDLDLCDQRVDDGVLARLPRFVGLRRLSIAGADLACSGVPADPTLLVGARLGEIHQQTLGFGPTDDGLRHLAALRGLRELDISVSGIGDRGLASLRPLELLEVLHLDGTGLTDRGLDTVASFSRLRALDLSRTLVGPEGLGALARLPALAFLSVSGIDLADAPDGLFGGFPALRVLQASRTGLPIPALWGCAPLERLDLSGHGLATEDTLLALADLPCLRTLFVADMRGDVAPAIAALRATGGAHLEIVRNREDGFMGAGGTFYAQAPKE